jgi:hypothetical protein
MFILIEVLLLFMLVFRSGIIIGSFFIVIGAGFICTDADILFFSKSDKLDTKKF